MHFFKLICLVLLFGISFYLMSEENKSFSDSDDEVLEVRTQFPRYRVLYNHQKVIHEVQDHKKQEESGKQKPEKNGV